MHPRALLHRVAQALGLGDGLFQGLARQDQREFLAAIARRALLLGVENLGHHRCQFAQ